MYCPNCGTESEAGAAFCHECGARLSAETPETEKAAVTNAEEQPAEQPVEQHAEQPAEQHTGQPEQQEEKPEQPAAEQPAGQTAEQPGYAAPVNPGAAPSYTGAPVRPNAGSPAVSMLKGCASSGPFIAGTAAFTVSFLCTVASIVMAWISGVGNMISQYAAQLDGKFASTFSSLLGSSFSFSKLINDLIDMIGGYQVIDKVMSSVYISRLLGCVPALLTALGLWLIFAASHGKDPDRMDNSGFVIIKTIWILKLIAVILTFVILIGACIVGIVFVPKLGELITNASSEVTSILSQFSISAENVGSTASGVILAVLIATLALIAICALFVILYTALVLKSVNTANKTAKTGVLYKKASAFVAVILFLGVAGSISTVFMQLLSLQILPLLITVSALAANVCFGVTIFKFNGKFREIAG